LTPLALGLDDTTRNTLTRQLGSWINLAVEDIRLGLPESMTPNSHPIVYLAYWHVRLLTYLFWPSAFARDIMWACQESAGILFAKPETVSPFSQHFMALTGLCATELSKSDTVGDGARSLVERLLTSPVPHSGWNAAIRATLEQKRRHTAEPEVRGTIGDRGLQHLADLATTKTAGKPESALDEFALRKADDYQDAGFDPRPMLRQGYLNCIAPLDTAKSS
jgi:hypothetical protein